MRDNSKQSYFTLFPSQLTPENQLIPHFQLGLKYFLKAKIISKIK